MFSIVRKSCGCACRYIVPTSYMPANLVSVRHYENPNTMVFKRLTEFERVGADKYPLIKRKNYIYKRIQHIPGVYKTTMKCILTKEVKGIGLKGTVVEVKKSLFRNTLFPRGDAVYASPENMDLYQSYRKASEEEGIDYGIKQLMLKLAGLHLPVFMNPDESWTLGTDHLKIALRKIGVCLKEENLVPPTTPVTELGSFTFRIMVYDRLAVDAQGTVYSSKEDEKPTSFPDLWRNTPLDTENPLQYLKKVHKKTPDGS